MSYEQEGDSEIYRADNCKYCHSDSNGPGSHQLYGRVTIATALPRAEKPNMQTCKQETEVNRLPFLLRIYLYKAGTFNAASGAMITIIMMQDTPSLSSQEVERPRNP